jgi:hypothetical protein
MTHPEAMKRGDNEPEPDRPRGRPRHEFQAVDPRARHHVAVRNPAQPEFAKKGLASYAVNVRTKCGPRAASSSTAPAELDPGAVPHGELRALRRC